jgi:general stress protein 26
MSTITVDRTAAVDKLRELVQDIRVAMFTTALPDGTLRSRPMMTQRTDFDGTFWFFSAWESGKVHELMQNAHANLAFAAPDDGRFVSVSGRASVVRDRRKAEELWHASYRAWFPRGLDDPNLSLLRVDVDSAEYWDAPSGKMVQLAGLVRAAVTGQPYHPDAGEHGQIQP